MNRREAVKKLGLGAGFLVASPTIVNLLQSCTGEPGFVPAFVNEGEGKALIQIVDLILPSDKEIPGAKELGIYEFVDAYWKEMLPVEEQIFVRLGWTSLNNIFSANFGKNISKGSSEEWNQILSKFLKSSKEQQEAYDKSNEDFVETLRKDNSAKPNDEAAAYAILTAVREMTIWGWKINKTIGTKVLWYDPVPGRQDACLPQDQVGNGRAMSLNW